MVGSVKRNEIHSLPLYKLGDSPHAILVKFLETDLKLNLMNLLNVRLHPFPRVNVVGFSSRFIIYSGPVHTYAHIFESATFSFRKWLLSTRIRQIRQRILIFFNPLSRVEQNKSATNPITCGRVNPDIFDSADAANSCPVSYGTINHYRALYSASSEHMSLQRSPGYLSESNTIGCKWAGKFNLYTLRVDGEIFESGKQKKNVDSKISGYVWTEH